MDRLFGPVVGPLLDAVAVGGVLFVGDDPSAALTRWCRQAGVELVSTPPGTPPDLAIAPSVVLLDGQAGAPLVEKALIGLMERASDVKLVVVHDVEQGILGSADSRAEAMRDIVLRKAPWSPRGRTATHVVPGLGGLVIAAPEQTARDLGRLWDDLAVSPTVRELVRAVEQDPTSGVGDLATARRIISRQDRELATLRAQTLQEARLHRRIQNLERKDQRLRSRRSVRVALWLAERAGPLVRLRRGQVTLAQLLRLPSRQSRRSRDAGATGQPHRTYHRFSSTDTGRFYDRLRAIIDGANPELVDRWAASEEALRVTPSWPADSDQPLVSVVMPTRNRADVLMDAIGTVTDQRYLNWELLVCDDAGDDDTEARVRALDDDRIQYHRLPRGGAAAARNAGLDRARGDLIAYLDSDNLWHPRFLDTMVKELVDNPGRQAAYCKYVDVVVSPTGTRVHRFGDLPFDYERLARGNFIDLNTFVHRRVLYERHGGFNPELVRRQDWDLVLKYAFLRDPLYVDRFLLLYQRNPALAQITTVHAQDTTSQPKIEAAVQDYHRNGLPTASIGPRQNRVTLISWDVSRNHLSKAYNLAEALAAQDPDQVQLQGFQFFEDPIFPPYADAVPAFGMDVLPGCPFPDFGDSFARAIARIRGEVVYAVKPRLPSLGVALLANYHLGRPVVLELNDLESVVGSPRPGQPPETRSLGDVDPADPRLLDPHGQLWTELMEGLASRIPVRVTHNDNLDRRFGGGAFFVRNPKDEAWFDPDRYDRDEVRRQLDIEPGDRVLLFGGMVREHKGVFQLAEMLDHADPAYRLLVVGSRETPDQMRLRARFGDRIRVVPPVDRNAMAQVNLAADGVVLWLDPEVPASHFQMPYKLTDALAMQVPVFANPIGDLGHLGREGYLRLVEFGDHAGLLDALDDAFIDQAATRQMVDAGRRLYLRQFSYRAARATLDLVLEAAADHQGTLPVAEEFADFFARFHAAHTAGAGTPGRRARTERRAAGSEGVA